MLRKLNKKWKKERNVRSLFQSLVESRPVHSDFKILHIIPVNFYSTEKRTETWLEKFTRIKQYNKIKHNK